MKIIFDSTDWTIPIKDVDPDKHVIAGIDRDNHIVLLRRKAYNDKAFVAAIMTKESLQSGNAYKVAGSASFQDILNIPHIKWHAFESIRDFFIWATENE